MKRIKIFAAALVMALGVGVLAGPIAAHADSPKDIVCSTIDEGHKDCSTTPSNGIDLNHVTTVVINILTTLVGVVSVIMIMVSGFRYMVSGGDSSKVAAAKNTLIYAIIGIVIVILSRVMVLFVLDKLK